MERKEKVLLTKLVTTCLRARERLEEEHDQGKKYAIKSGQKKVNCKRGWGRVKEKKWGGRGDAGVQVGCEPHKFVSLCTGDQTDGWHPRDCWVLNNSTEKLRHTVKTSLRDTQDIVVLHRTPQSRKICSVVQCDTPTAHVDCFMS